MESAVKTDSHAFKKRHRRTGSAPAILEELSSLQECTAEEEIYKPEETQQAPHWVEAIHIKREQQLRKFRSPAFSLQNGDANGFGFSRSFSVSNPELNNIMKSEEEQDAEVLPALPSTNLDDEEESGSEAAPLSDRRFSEPMDLKYFSSTLALDSTELMTDQSGQSTTVVVASVATPKWDPLVRRKSAEQYDSPSTLHSVLKRSSSHDDVHAKSTSSTSSSSTHVRFRLPNE